jgi:hypothetical protein
MEPYTSDPQTRKRKIECKPELVISSLQRFYLSHPEINKVLTYLNGDAPLSLRIIDWFVTKYSRKNFVRYQLNGQDFLVYLSYKGQLKAYSKQYFDPNCRRERIMFKIPGHDQDFYNYLNRFTDQQKCEAFLEGFELGSQSGGSGVIPAVNI